MSWLSLSVGWENGPERTYDCFIQSLTSWKFKQTVRCLIWFYTICQCPKCPSQDCIDNPLSKARWRHSDTNSAAINNRYLDFVQTRVLISLVKVNDNQVDNNPKEILVYVYLGWIVSNRSKNGGKSTKCIMCPEIPDVLISEFIFVSCTKPQRLEMQTLASPVYPTLPLSSH